MTMIEALGQLVGTLAVIGLAAAAGYAAIITAAWIWYRRDGGRAGLFRFFRGC